MFTDYPNHKLNRYYIHLPLYFPRIALEDLADVPGAEVLVGQVDTPLGRLDLPAVETQQPIGKAGAAVGPVGDQDLVVGREGEGPAVEELVVQGAQG